MRLIFCIKNNMDGKRQGKVKGCPGQGPQSSDGQGGDETNAIAAGVAAVALTGFFWQHCPQSLFAVELEFHPLRVAGASHFLLPGPDAFLQWGFYIRRRMTKTNFVVTQQTVKWHHLKIYRNTKTWKMNPEPPGSKARRCGWNCLSK